MGFAEVSNGVATPLPGFASTPLGLWGCGAFPQGSSFLATLGFEPESRWDSEGEFPNGIRIKMKRKITIKKKMDSTSSPQLVLAGDGAIAYRSRRFEIHHS